MMRSLRELSGRRGQGKRGYRGGPHTARKVRDIAPHEALWHGTCLADIGGQYGGFSHGTRVSALFHRERVSIIAFLELSRPLGVVRLFDCDVHC